MVRSSSQVEPHRNGQEQGRLDLCVELRSIFMRIRIVVRAIVRCTVVTRYIRTLECMYEVDLSQVGSLTKSSVKVVTREQQKYITWVVTKCGQVFYVN